MRSELIRALRRALINDPEDGELLRMLTEARALSPEDDLARLYARLDEVHVAMSRPRAPEDAAGLLKEAQRLEDLIRDTSTRLALSSRSTT